MTFGDVEAIVRLSPQRGSASRTMCLGVAFRAVVQKQMGWALIGVAGRLVASKHALT